MSTEVSTITSSDLERLTAEVANLEFQLALLQTVIKKIDSDTYGKCEACGADIEISALNSDPQILFCDPHAPPGDSIT